MDKSSLYVVLWNPSRRYIQTETLENHLKSVQRMLFEGFDSRNSEVLLEITDDLYEQTKLANKWSDLLNPKE